MADIEIYANEYGEKLQVRTWLAEIASASAITIELKNLATDAVASLVATAISTYPAGTPTDPIVATEYGVQATIATGWAATRIGTWIGQVKAVFAEATLYGKAFSLEIKASPTAA